jgi:signal transduction histidine kinase
VAAEDPKERGRSSDDRRREDRRKAIRRGEDQVQQQVMTDRDRKLQSLLELGQLIGLDLQIDGMLVQIAQKAAEVMGAERCSLYLHDPKSDELWTMVALGMEGKVIRIPTSAGLAGSCFLTKEVINLEDAYSDPRFNRELDARTGYRTRSVLCVPIYNRAGEVLGVIQLLNKKTGGFAPGDETFLKTFGNHAAVFIEIAQLQRARIEALEQSGEELRRLNRAKDKTLHHLSHELKTPLAVVQGIIRILRRKAQTLAPSDGKQNLFDTLERHLKRLLDIQQEADSILKSYQKVNEGFLGGEFDRLWGRLEEIPGIPPDLMDQCRDVKAKMAQYLPTRSLLLKKVLPLAAVEKALERAKQKAKDRELHFLSDGRKDLAVLTDPGILDELLAALLKNAVENTPDEGTIRILLEEVEGRVVLKVQDFGVGITGEDQKYIFDGLFTTRETDLYTSKMPYEFNAGGKGLDLLQMRVYGQRFGFDLTVESRRCIYLPTNRDLCPGRISLCAHCRKVEDCLASGGSAFSAAFPAAGEGD